MFSRFFIYFICIIVPLNCYSINDKSNQLSIAKKQLLHIYQDYPFTFLCESEFNSKGQIQTRPCTNCPVQNTKVQWMQIVKLKEILKHQNCFKEKICFDDKGKRFGGIRCCKKINPLTKEAESDLHNLVPEIKALKKIRNTYRFDYINNINILRSTCNLKIDSTRKIIQPSEELQGMIGRTYLFMNLKYNIQLSQDELKLYEKWHRNNPPTEWEKKRNLAIAKMQGDTNQFI